VKAHLERHAPPGVRVTVTVKENGAIPYWMSGEHPGNQAARAILVEEYGKEPYLARSGGSIPVTALFLESLGAYTVSFGFGLDDERQHSPNEFFRLSNFVRGQRAYCKLLHGLAG
jgi:acetylornithine deacetylase/succinyl-diaminopimelate desuccinylase-like protein